MRPSPALATRDKVLFLLKTKGPQPAAELAERLSVTAMAVRQHLDRLLAEDKVAFDDERQAVGRPRRVWRVTERGSAEFPDNHADLTVELIDAVRSAFGEDGIDRLLALRTAAQLARYREAVPPPSAPLGDRVAALARLRNREGYMAESRRLKDGGYLLVENHCPICAAARACLGLCAQELELFRRVLGRGVEVERTEHLIEGARRCAYRIGS